MLGVIIQCPSCRALTTVSQAHVIADQAAVALRCPECGAQHALPLVEDVAPAPLPSDAAPTLVPKPALAKVDAAPATALVSATVPPSAPEQQAAAVAPQPKATTNADTEAQAAIRTALEGVGAADPGSEGVVEDLLKLIPTWEDQAGHQRLIKRAALEDKLGALGVRYRVHRCEGPRPAGARAHGSRRCVSPGE